MRKRKTIALLVLLLAAPMLSGCMDYDSAEAGEQADPSGALGQSSVDPVDVNGSEGSREPVAGGAIDQENDTAREQTPDIKAVVLVYELPNVYHEVFRRPNWTAHPSSFIRDYPADALPLNLSLGAESWRDAYDRDQEVWASVRPGETYYVPGTAFVSLVLAASPGSSAASLPRMDLHGSGVSHNILAGASGQNSTAALALYLSPRDLGSFASYAAETPYVTIVSSSAVSLFVSPPGWDGERQVRAVAAAGKPWFQAAAHSGGTHCGAAPPTICPSQGPPWLVAVGEAYHPRLVTGSGPLDISAPHEGCPLPDRLRGFEEGCRGTSFSAPYIAGMAADLISDVRAAWGWNECGTDLACLIEGRGEAPGDGPLADGALSREEVLDAIYRSANDAARMNGPSDQMIAYHDEGWGIATRDTLEDARRILWGQMDPPERSEIEAWWERHQALRHAYWDPWIDIWDETDPACKVFRHPTCV